MNPKPEQIEFISKVLENSIKLLIENDGDIFIENPPPDNSRDKRLYENCINHRLAFYLENEIKDSPDFANYLVDCEYDKLGNKKKQFSGEDKGIRPDIIVHGRSRGGSERVSRENYLVIEANIKSPNKDKGKIKNFIDDINLKYLFGFTISYCKYPNFIEGILYYKKNNEIAKFSIQVSKSLWTK